MEREKKDTRNDELEGKREEEVCTKEGQAYGMVAGVAS